MHSINSFIKLCRLNQWYKNLLILLPLIFSKSLFHIELWPKFILGFLALAFISSAGYILNDFIDIKNDQTNPEKKNRPLASGKIKIKGAAILTIILVLISLTIALLLDLGFFVIVAALFLLTLIYSLFLKHEPFADIIIVSSNFILRAIGGSFIMKIPLSSWIILGTFFFALFLTVGKRYGEIFFLRDGAIVHRKVLKKYNLRMLESFINISISILIIAFGIFTFFSKFGQNLIYLLPLFVYIVFRYSWLVKNGSIIGRHPHKVYKDKKMFFCIILFVIFSVFLIYLS